METTLHQQLKNRYANSPGECEHQLGAYRIDVRQRDLLIEVQCSSLAALRDKVRCLTPDYSLKIVKPVIRKKFVVRKKWKTTISQKFERPDGNWLDLFEELVHFVTVFPRRNLELEFLLVDVIETRRPSKKRWSRKRYRVEDRQLLDIVESRTVKRPQDLFSLLPPLDLPPEFTTKELAESLGQPRWIAQKIAYCLRETTAIEQVGKQGNALSYRKKERRTIPRLRRAA